MKKSYSIQVKLAVPILCLAILVLGSMTFIMALSGHKNARKSATEETVATAQAAASDMRLAVERGLDIARTMAHQLEAQKKHGFTSREMVNDTLRELLEKNKFLIGTWTGWEPNTWDARDTAYVDKTGHDKTGRFVPYYNWEKGKSVLTPLIGYDQAGAGDYYLVPKSRQKETMVEPYLYPIDGVDVLMTSAVVPIVIEGQFVGVAGVDLPLKEIQAKAATIKPFETSEAFVITAAGNYVSHPDEKLITKPADYPFEPEKFQNAIKKGELFTQAGVDSHDGIEYLYVVAPMNIGFTEAPWALVVRTPMKSVLAEANSALITQIFIACLTISIAVWSLLFP